MVSFYEVQDEKKSTDHNDQDEILTSLKEI